MSDQIWAVVSDQELAEALSKTALARHLKHLRPTWKETNRLVQYHREQYRRTGLIDIDFKQVNHMLNRDLEQWFREVKKLHKTIYRPLVRWLSADLKSKISDPQSMVSILSPKLQQSFTVQAAKRLDSTAKLVTGHAAATTAGQLVIRNIYNHEDLLKSCMNDRRSFWFIDSGYTNFLVGRKMWHRLIQNNIHHVLSTPARGFWPADRLHTLPVLPRPWTKHGKTILVIENSENHYKMLGTDVLSWREKLHQDISAHTNRPIEFRPKHQDKKNRDSVYNLLQQNPKKYYCVISDSSAAAVEAIWLGVPVITLQPHITSTVARTEISHVNDLYRGEIGDWLCALTYSQWTYDEIVTGDAVKYIAKYHA